MALLRALNTAKHVYDYLIPSSDDELQIDESVAVFGQGVVGQLTTALCRLSGADPVIAVDLDADRLALAEQSGATHTVDASKEDGAEAVKSITGGGAQSVVHATPTSKTLVDCMEAAADRGIVVVVGWPFDTVETGLRDELLRKELQVRGSNPKSTEGMTMQQRNGR